MTLTNMETLMVEHLRGTGDLEEWFFTDEIVVEGIDKNQKSGVISSLVQKGIVESIIDNGDNLTRLVERAEDL